MRLFQRDGVRKVDEMIKIPGRIGAINDLSGFGRCSLSLMLPVISACGYQCCPVPTAVLSTSNDFKSPFLRELTEDMPDYISHWEGLGLKFQGIYSGYFSSPRQIAHAVRFAESFRKEETVFLVDPVMGDRGKISPRCNEDFMRGYYDLLAKADIVTPNLTEALYLTEIPYVEFPAEDTIDRAARRLMEAGPSQVVITGIRKEDRSLTYLYSGSERQIVSVPYCPQERTGTGDLFASILLCKYLDGKSLGEGAQLAAEFISEVLTGTMKLGVPVNEGICFEPFLGRLCPGPGTR